MLSADLKTTAPETVAYISMSGPYDQIPEAMGRLYGWVSRQGLQPLGMPEGVYLDDPKTTAPDEARWELRAPIADAADDTAADELGCGIKHVEPHLVAYAMHRGAYEDVEKTYDGLMTWIGASGYRIAGPPEEVYYSDPQTTQPSDYLTEIRIPVAQVQH